MRSALAALLLLALVACGRDEPHLPTPKTSTTVALGTIPGAPGVTTTTLIPSDASTPAAGNCGNAPEGGPADITLSPDVPSPRCVIVHSLNQLRFTNKTDHAQVVELGYDSATLQPGETHLFDERVGDYWAPGVHRVNTGALYAGSGPEVWLQS
jgi:hypothetical protein